MTSQQWSAVRAVARAALVCATAFGLRLDAVQIGAIQLAGEAVLQAGVQFFPPKP
jgi:hypothetical protein